MALYHFSVSQIKRSAGQSVLAAAAYRAGERLYSEYYDEISDYTRKGGVLHTEILLPAHAPDFPKLLMDMEIMVDGEARNAIRAIDMLFEAVRMKII